MKFSLFTVISLRVILVFSVLGATVACGTRVPSADTAGVEVFKGIVSGRENIAAAIAGSSPHEEIVRSATGYVGVFVYELMTRRPGHVQYRIDVNPQRTLVVSASEEHAIGDCVVLAIPRSQIHRWHFSLGEVGVTKDKDCSHIATHTKPSTGTKPFQDGTSPSKE